MKYFMPQGSLISYMSTLVKEKGGVNLAQGLPGFEPPQELISCLKHVASTSIHQYPPGIGNFKVLSILEDHYLAVFPVKRDHFLITQGATEAISLLYLYLKQKIGKQFSVMAFAPAYESYRQLPLHFGQGYIEAEMLPDGGFDYVQTEKMIRQNNVKIFFLASPANPYGRIMPKAYVESLVEICVRNKCYLIFDAVYKELYYRKPPYVPLEHLGEYVFYVNSFSKLLSVTGWRVGYMIADPLHMPDIRRMHDYTGLCANSVLQEAIACYLEKGNMGRDYVSQLRERFLSSFERLASVLEKLGFTIPPTDGGYFIWSELPRGFDDGFETAMGLYEKTGIATVPGIHFSPSAKRFLRFNIARPHEDIDKAVDAVTMYFS
jgi:aspartate/methionine/tyrosine aminotransferase